MHGLHFEQEHKAATWGAWDEEEHFCKAGISAIGLPVLLAWPRVAWRLFFFFFAQRREA